MDIFSPIDNSLVGTIPEMSATDVNKAVEEASLAQKDWQEIPVEERVNLHKKVAELLEEEKDEFIKLITFEIGKPKKEAEDEVARTIEMIGLYCEEVLKLGGEILKTGKKTANISRVPLGVVLAIGPFNYPLNEPCPKIIAALLSGNSCVFKPSTQGAIAGIRFAKLFEEAGFPENMLKVVTGKTGEIGDLLASHPKIAAINFTGSYKTAQHIASICGVKKLVLGLSGKDAAIVLPDCDLELATSEIAKGAFSFAGQRCTAIKRVLAEESIADRLVDKLTRKVEEQFILGDPRKEGITLGPVISKVAADYFEELVNDAKAKGGVIIIGGERKGQFIEATIIDHVSLDMRIAWEEPFSPVLPIIRMRNEEEAIDIANKSEYGLESCIFTKDIDKATTIAGKLEVGTVQINGRSSRWPDNFPFSGVKHSGLGMVAGAKYLLTEMTTLKTIVENTI